MTQSRKKKDLKFLLPCLLRCSVVDHFIKTLYIMYRMVQCFMNHFAYNGNVATHGAKCLSAQIYRYNDTSNHVLVCWQNYCHCTVICLSTNGFSFHKLQEKRRWSPGIQRHHQTRRQHVNVMMKRYIAIFVAACLKEKAASSHTWKSMLLQVSPMCTRICICVVFYSVFLPVFF